MRSVSWQAFSSGNDGAMEEFKDNGGAIRGAPIVFTFDTNSVRLGQISRNARPTETVFATVVYELKLRWERIRCTV